MAHFTCKLGHVKQFVKAMNQDGNPFQHVCAMLPFLSDAKKKAGIFTGPQVRITLQCEKLEEVVTAREA